jgi:hypothetical protein
MRLFAVQKCGQAINANVPFTENTIIKSDHKCNYACSAFNIKVHFYGEHYPPQT